MQDNKYIIDPDKSWMNIEENNRKELSQKADEERGGMVLVTYMFIANTIIFLGLGIFLLCKLFF